MTQAHERTATLSEMVAEEIRALMARRKVSGRELAGQLGVSPSWISYRLSGKQPIDVNDLLRIANALSVGVHELLPSPEDAARAAEPSAIPRYLPQDIRPSEYATHVRDNRPLGHPGMKRDLSGVRTAYVKRGPRGRRD
jgi:transcriptional regulator with XRE-family HTH domain